MRSFIISCTFSFAVTHEKVAWGVTEDIIQVWLNLQKSPGNSINPNTHTDTHRYTHTCCVFGSCLPRQQFSRWLVSSHFLLLCCAERKGSGEGERGGFPQRFFIYFVLSLSFLSACLRKRTKSTRQSQTSLTPPPPPPHTAKAASVYPSLSLLPLLLLLFPLMPSYSSAPSSCLPRSSPLLLPSYFTACRLAALLEFNKWNSLNFIHSPPSLHPFPSFPCLPVRARSQTISNFPFFLTFGW